jgi:hypothetical protein
MLLLQTNERTDDIIKYVIKLLKFMVPEFGEYPLEYNLLITSILFLL